MLSFQCTVSTGEVSSVWLSANDPWSLLSLVQMFLYLSEIFKTRTVIFVWDWWESSTCLHLWNHICVEIGEGKRHLKQFSYGAELNALFCERQQVSNKRFPNVKVNLPELGLSSQDLLLLCTSSYREAVETFSTLFLHF